jgi:HSP90 family molecular chaperone
MAHFNQLIDTVDTNNEVEEFISFSGFAKSMTKAVTKDAAQEATEAAAKKAAKETAEAAAKTETKTLSASIKNVLQNKKVLVGVTGAAVATTAVAADQGLLGQNAQNTIKQAEQKVQHNVDNQINTVKNKANEQINDIKKNIDNQLNSLKEHLPTIPSFKDLMGIDFQTLVFLIILVILNIVGMQLGLLKYSLGISMIMSIVYYVKSQSTKVPENK